MEGTIGAEEFRKRLLAIVGPGGGPGLPRRQRDREIFLRAAAQGLRQPTYSEPDLNAALGDWLSLVVIHSARVRASQRRRQWAGAGETP